MLRQTGAGIHSFGFFLRTVLGPRAAPILRKASNSWLVMVEVVRRMRLVSMRANTSLCRSNKPRCIGL